MYHFTEELDLYACWDECFNANGTVLIATSGTENTSKAFYSLSAVVRHHGSGMDKGHYSALCLDADSDTWIHYNDRKVSISSENDVQKAQAYLLFYERAQEIQETERSVVL